MEQYMASAKSKDDALWILTQVNMQTEKCPLEVIV